MAIPIAFKGNQSNAAMSHTQLASASAHVQAVHIGAWNQTLALVFSTELPAEGPSRCTPCSRVEPAAD